MGGEHLGTKNPELAVCSLGRIHGENPQIHCGTAFAEAAPVMTVEGEDFMKIYCEPYIWILYYIYK